MANKSRIRDIEFDKLVEESASRILVGLIDGGGKSFKAAVWLAMHTAIQWEKENGRGSTMKLLEAAPFMLGALKWARQELKPRYEDCYYPEAPEMIHYNKLVDAINKAEGVDND